MDSVLALVAAGSGAAVVPVIALPPGDGRWSASRSPARLHPHHRAWRSATTGRSTARPGAGRPVLARPPAPGDRRASAGGSGCGHGRPHPYDPTATPRRRQPLAPPGRPPPRWAGSWRASGWESLPVAEEIRRNAAALIAAGRPLVPGVLGYDDTVLPQLENALLAGHDIIFLGERGQAKTRMIRSPGRPARRVAAHRRRLGDQRRPLPPGLAATPATWSPSRATTRRSTGSTAAQRFGEKLATPDTSIADLIGEVDPIKVAEGRYLSRRADPALRPGAADQPRHLRHQRAARPGRADPGRPAQRPRGARRADPRLQDPPARSTSCWWPRPTPRTTPTAAGSSRRSRTASARRSAPTTRSTPRPRCAIMEQEADVCPTGGRAGRACPPS